MESRRKLSAAIAAALLVAVAIAVVGVVSLDDDEPETSQSVGAEEAAAGAEPPDPRAVELFTGTCGQCHTLTVAGTDGDIGPNLDGTQYDRARVLRAIATGAGGSGQMAPNLLEGEDAELVAELIAGDEPLRSAGDPPP